MYPDANSMLLYKGVAPDGTPIHILGATASMTDVLEGFDISCHAYVMKVPAGNDLGFITAHRFATATNCVRIIAWSDPRTTLARAIKFAERYEDYSMWTDVKTHECAAAAFGVPFVTAEQADRLAALEVSVGL